jgi:putative transposase
MTDYPEIPKGGTTVDKDIRERIAIKRYQIISPVLAEPARAQNEYFRQQAQREHDFPHYGPRNISISTMKSWLRDFRSQGFNALKPRVRSDAGRPRRLNDQRLKVIEVHGRNADYSASPVQIPACTTNALGSCFKF